MNGPTHDKDKGISGPSPGSQNDDSGSNEKIKPATFQKVDRKELRERFRTEKSRIGATQSRSRE